MSLLAIVLAASGLQAPANGQPQAGGDNQAICLSDGHYWRGSARDVADIRRVPVPESYRRHFFADTCTRWQLIEETLIDWHLAFGNEASTTAAIAFLEADFMAHMPAPAAFQVALARTWRDAEREFARPRQAGDTGSAENGPAMRRLYTLVEAHQNMMLLTRQYLRAAEFYESPSLRAKAQAWFAIAKPPSTSSIAACRCAMKSSRPAWPGL